MHLKLMRATCFYLLLVELLIRKIFMETIIYRPLNGESPNNYVAKVRDQITDAKRKGTDEEYGLRVPLVVFSHDRKVALQLSRREVKKESTGQLILPTTTARNIEPDARYQRIIGDHFRNKVLLEKGNGRFRIDQLGVVREFDVKKDERIVGEITCVPAVVSFDAIAAHVGIKYRYQERYGHIQWFAQDEAAQILQDEYAATDKSKAVDESYILFNMIAHQL